MDPLSDVLSLLKPRSNMSGGFDVGWMNDSKACRARSRDLASRDAGCELMSVPGIGPAYLQCHGSRDRARRWLLQGSAARLGVCTEKLNPRVALRRLATLDLIEACKNAPAGTTVAVGGMIGAGRLPADELTEMLVHAAAVLEAQYPDGSIRTEVANVAAGGYGRPTFAIG